MLLVALLLMVPQSTFVSFVSFGQVVALRVKGGLYATALGAVGEPHMTSLFYLQVVQWSRLGRLALPRFYLSHYVRVCVRVYVCASPITGCFGSPWVRRDHSHACLWLWL